MVVICIPIYKTKLNWYEEVSLNQAFRVFGGKYDIFFCTPESISTYFEDVYGSEAGIAAFPNEYFTSIRAYSELCLTKDLYQRFEMYEYMLLYQLDAFVFSDRLMDFCKLNYDYIGADTCDGKDWNKLNVSVGCGGFSLRKIKSAIRILEDIDILIGDHPLQSMFYEKEDVFWGYCGHNKKVKFLIPDSNNTRDFAVTFGAGVFFREKSIYDIPFGTHAWHRYDYDVWKPIIERYGYTLPDIASVDYVSTDEVYLQNLEYRSMFQVIKRSDGVINKINECSVWGAGYNGIKCIRMLNKLGVQINHVYDWNLNALNGCEDIEAPRVELPLIGNICRTPTGEIIIITTKLDAEIIGKLNNRRYISLQDFYNTITNVDV